MNHDYCTDIFLSFEMLWPVPLSLLLLLANTLIALHSKLQRCSLKANALVQAMHALRRWPAFYFTFVALV